MIHYHHLLPVILLVAQLSFFCSLTDLYKSLNEEFNYLLISTEAGATRWYVSPAYFIFDLTWACISISYLLSFICVFSSSKLPTSDSCW